MNHNERLQAVKGGTDYKAPLRAINETIDGIVHCALIVREHETTLTPEVRALDAIGTQVLRELKQRADMIRALVDRLNIVEDELKLAREAAYNAQQGTRVRENREIEHKMYKHGAQSPDAPLGFVAGEGSGFPRDVGELPRSS